MVRTQSQVSTYTLHNKVYIHVHHEYYSCLQACCYVMVPYYSPAAEGTMPCATAAHRRWQVGYHLTCPLCHLPPQVLPPSAA